MRKLILCALCVCCFGVSLAVIAPAAHAGSLIIILPVGIVINNGSAPPDPDNILDYYSVDPSVHVRNVGCPPGWPSVWPDWPDWPSVSPDDPCLNAGDATEVTLVSGGSVSDLVVMDSSAITMTGGYADLVAAYGSSAITMSGGLGAGGVRAYGSSTITMSGGSVGEDLEANGYSSVKMSSGWVQERLVARDSAALTMTGGLVGGVLAAEDFSTLMIVGSGFAVDGTPVPFGNLTALNGTLTGTLASGESLDNEFWQGGGFYTGTIRLVPEPSTGLLVGGGLVGLLAVQRRRFKRTG